MAPRVSVDRAAPSGEGVKSAAGVRADRDRFIDLLRAVSILAVVVGHWLMDVINWEDPQWTSPLLALIPALQPVTWVLFTIQLFFFVGGFTNVMSLRTAHRARQGYLAFLRHRLERLLRPTAVLLMVWLPLAWLLLRLWPSSIVLESILLGVFRPLWFIPVYILVVALTPVTVALHRRFGWFVPAALAAAIVVVDIARLGFGLTGLAPLNFAAGLLLAYQVGYFYADGRLQRVPRRRLAVVAIGALAAMVLLTTVGPYSASMLAVPDERVSNWSPPSIAFLVQTVWLISLALLVRAPASRWMARPRAWAAVITLNLHIMTIYLWHTSAWSLTIMLLHLAGIPLLRPGTSAWYVLLPLWLTLLAAVLAGFVAVFGRFEQVSPLKPSGRVPVR